jgi:hypothetical protein
MSMGIDLFSIVEMLEYVCPVQCCKALRLQIRRSAQLTRRALLVLLAISLLAYIGCGGGANSALRPSPPAIPDSPQASQPDTQTPPAKRNMLEVAVPALAALQPGAEFDYVLSAHFVEVLYQGSGRIIYDSAVVQPVSVKRGSAIPQASIFSAKLNTPPMKTATGETSFIPFAFTGLPGSRGCGECDAELLRVRFKLLNSASTASPVSLLNEPEFLQVRGMDGARLSFDLSTEVVSQ